MPASSAPAHESAILRHARARAEQAGYILTRTCTYLDRGGAVDLLFITDIVVNFRTAYDVDGHRVQNPRLIARRYRTSGWLCATTWGGSKPQTRSSSHRLLLTPLGPANRDRLGHLRGLSPSNDCVSNPFGSQTSA